jgi:hypothetical protein
MTDDKWSIRDVAEALIKHGLIEKQTEQELRDCKTCIHSNKGNCAGTEECHECMWDSKYEQQSCDDAISRQAVKEQMLKYGFHAPDMTVTEFIEDLPPVNPTKTGHWVEENIDKGSRKIFCSECGCPPPFEHVSDGDVYSANGYGVINKTKFCPNCGAKMKSEENE